MLELSKMLQNDISDFLRKTLKKIQNFDVRK